MAYTMRYSVSTTPVVTGTIDEGEGTLTTIGSDIGKTLGASASIIATTGFDTEGYTAGVVEYGNAPIYSGAKLQLGVDGKDYDLIFIKHTGCEFSSPTALGVANTAQDLIVYIETTAVMATFAKFSIPSGGAVILPKLDLGVAMGVWVESSGANTIAVEFALVEDA